MVRELAVNQSGYCPLHVRVVLLSAVSKQYLILISLPLYRLMMGYLATITNPFIVIYYLSPSLPLDPGKVGVASKENRLKGLEGRRGWVMVHSV